MSGGFAGPGIRVRLIPGAPSIVALRICRADAITAAVPHQGRQTPMRGSHDFADEKHVVARRVKRVMPAFEPCRAAFDQRRIGLAKAECHACEAISVWTRKAARELDLIVREHVDHVLRGTFEDRQAARAAREAPY